MKYIKTFRIVAVALTLALLVAIVPATPALAQPTITLTPASGSIGTTVTVVGTNFGAYVNITVYIFFNYESRASALVNVFGNFSASFTVPTYATQGLTQIVVRTGFLPTDALLALNYFTVTKAAITLSTSSSYVGEEIKVSGTNFANNTNVTIYFDEEEIGNTVADSLGSFTNVTFTIPESYQGSHTLKIKDAKQNSDTAVFSTKQSIAISSTSGTMGNQVTVSGTGFKDNQEITITFDGSRVTTSPAPVTTNSKGSFSASFSIPAVSGGSHEVAASDSINRASQAFTTVPITASFSSIEGYIGDEVTVSGSGFQASRPVTVTFYDKAVKTGSTNSDGSFSLSFTVPDLAAGNYRLRVSDGINIKEDYFKIKTIVGVSISPITSATLPGHVGSEVTVSGVGFVSGRTVAITYDNVVVATAIVQSDGSFLATFPAPISRHGEHSLSATDLTNTISSTFTIESEAPPAPSSLEPAMNAKAKAEGYFDWNDVTDASLPITYTLQIATDTDFADGSIVLEKAGLTRSEYTVTQEQKLESVSKENPYYWRVKAIDSASNESQWSSTRSFYVTGFFLAALPQPLIYILFGIGALLIGILGFWLGWKTASY